MNPFIVCVALCVMCSVAGWALHERARGRFPAGRAVSLAPVTQADWLRWVLMVLALVAAFTALSAPAAQGAPWFLPVVGAMSTAAVFAEARACQGIAGQLPGDVARVLIASRLIGLLGLLGGAGLLAWALA